MIIALVGKTSSGKDTVARYLKEEYGIDSVVSYTTRPMRTGETNGVEHYFISKEDAKRILESEKVLAYTINDKTGIEYFASESCLTSDTLSYIINPDGIKFLDKNWDCEYTSIYVDCDEDLIIERALKRGDIKEVLEKRLSSERDEFNAFRDNKEYSFYVQNNGTLDELLSQVDRVMEVLGYEKI